MGFLSQCVPVCGSRLAQAALTPKPATPASAATGPLRRCQTAGFCRTSPWKIIRTCREALASPAYWADLLIRYLVPGPPREPGSTGTGTGGKNPTPTPQQQHDRRIIKHSLSLFFNLPGWDLGVSRVFCQVGHGVSRCTSTASA